MGGEALHSAAIGAISGAGMGAGGTMLSGSVSDAESATINNKPYISMEDFTNQHSPVWNNVDYTDDATKIDIMQKTHNNMVADGSVVRVSADVIEQVGEHFPDLRQMKKAERTPILKDAMNALKGKLREFLSGFKNQGFEFEVNGKILEARLYSTGINEVMEKVTQEKADMLYSTPAIFQNARYLYSTQDYDGDPNVYRWNYFYTPVQIGEDIVGVRIAVRDLAKQSESQIYNWGIKKGTTLDGVGDDLINRKSHGVSSEVPTDSIYETEGNVNPGAMSDVQVVERASQLTAEGKRKATAADFDGILQELGEEETLKRLYNSQQFDRPTGMVEVDGRRVDANAYVDAYEQTLPADPAALQETIRHLEKQRTAEILQMEKEGTLKNYKPHRLKIDLQLFAAKRKWELLQLEPGEDGSKVRQFWEKRLKGNDEMHSEELLELMAGRSETYDPISNQKTLDKANTKLRDAKYSAKLLRQLSRRSYQGRLTEVDVAAATRRAMEQALELPTLTETDVQYRKAFCQIVKKYTNIQPKCIFIKHISRQILQKAYNYAILTFIVYTF